MSQALLSPESSILTVPPREDAQLDRRCELLDERAAESARAALRTSPYRALTRLACDVRYGVARIDGEVSSYFLKQIAQHLIADVEGIRRIENRVEVVAR